MSSSVVWKNLQLFDSAEAALETQIAAKKSEGRKKPQIDAQRRGVKKNLRKAKKEEFLQKSTILGEKGLLLPSLKHSGPKINKTTEEDIVQENLKRLQNLSKIHSAELKSADKIFESATRKKIKLDKKDVKETKTVFTEADFVNFAKNYTLEN